MQRTILHFFGNVAASPLPIVNKNSNEQINIGNTKNINKSINEIIDVKSTNLEGINENNFFENEFEEEEEEVPTTNVRFKRLRTISDDDSNDKENNTTPNNKRSKTLKESIDNKNNVKTNFTSPIPSKKQLISKPITPSTKEFLTKFQNVMNESDMNDSPKVISESIRTEESFDHLSLNFLKKDFLMDSQRRRPNDPEYDATTLYVPQEFMLKVTPGMRQWWQLKVKGYFDTLLFFKVGKFYELYHMDAVIAVKELGISLMRGNYAHCGFPEIAFTKMSDQLVQKGFKVARVEQTETMDAMTERCQKKRTKDKVVNREVCQVVTPGTRTFSLRNSSTKTITQDEGEDMTFDDNVGALLYSIKESPLDYTVRNKSRNVIEIGIALVNTNTGRFMLTQFEDDNLRSNLRTMFSRFCPNEILYQKYDLSKDTMHLLNTTLAAVKKEALFKSKQFLCAEDALQRLLEGGYFLDTPKDRISRFGLPIGLSEVLNEGDNLGRSPAPHYALAVNSLGGLMFYLQKCLIDKYLISLGDFLVYHPTEETKCKPSLSSNIVEPFYKFQSNMIMDSSALYNLDLLKNSNTGGVEGTLLERLDFTATSFGKRLLRQWIASPLCHPQSILERQNAVTELMELESKLNCLRQKLRSLPDLEKLIARIHAVGLTQSVLNHPDSRAVLYENFRYSHRKINDFIVTISAFKTVIDIQSLFCELNFENKIMSPVLKKITLCKQDNDMGDFPFLNDIIDFFQKAFDHDQAKKDGKIIPEKGVDEDYDIAMIDIKSLESELGNYLTEQATLLHCKVNYFGSARNRYQLEIPESKCTNLPRTYVPSSQKKGFRRYETVETRRLLTEMMQAEDKRDLALKNIMSSIFSKFDKHYPLWSKAIDCLAQLDVLLSFGIFNRGVDGGPMVRPKISELSPGLKAFLLITEGRYPCKAKTQTGQFISNTIKLGNVQTDFLENENKNVMILTGPNMGGKSTLMRQAALIVILAQMGCYVPAEGPVIFTPVDRLLTRQGANDAIGSGQSTLQVEMNETASILSYMTANSFLLVDELGRGTATHDGCALACSILNCIVDKSEPRTIFSTHFHKLLEEQKLVDKVQLCHMACMVEDDINVTPSNETKLQNITFLYKLTTGGCPKSYGFNAARLADIPEMIIINGLKKSRVFEEETLIYEFKQFLTVNKYINKEELAKWQNKFRKINLL